MVGKNPALMCAWKVFQFVDQKPTHFELIFVFWMESGKRLINLDIMSLSDSQESYFKIPSSFVCTAILYRKIGWF